MERFLDTAFDRIEQNGTTDCTIQRVVDRSEQSLCDF